MKDQMTWEKLTAQMAEALTEECDRPAAMEERRGGDGSDIIHEVADQVVPVYNGQLLELLNDHPEIAHLDDKGLVDFTDFNLYQFLMVSTYEKLVAWASTEWCKEYAKEKGGHLAEMAKHMGWPLK